MASSLLATSLLLTQCIAAIAQSVSTLQLGMLQPTPSPTESEDGSGSGQLLERSIRSTAAVGVFPSPTSNVKQPSPDFTIKLRLNFSTELSDEEQIEVQRSLSLLVENNLELSISPEVFRESENVFNVLIVASSSVNIDVASGNISAIAALLTVDIEELRGLPLQDFEILSITANPLENPFSTVTVAVTMTIDHLAFPLWQWFVYAMCVIISTTATTLMICACCHRCAWQQKRRRSQGRGYKNLLLSPHRQEEMNDFVHPADLQELDPAIVRKVSRISFRPRGPMRLLSHPLTPEELLEFTLNPVAVYAEYSSMNSNMITMAEVPPGAEEKNRFKDVLPNPHTRVALFLKFAVPNSDYINANYIRGYRNAPKAYIATQGPLYWTVADFWRMVWEQKCSTIIMATDLEEGGVTKCTRYWPDERVQHMTTYEHLELILKRKTSNRYYTTTTFHLRHKQKLVTREVTHFWFTSWPDHGVPTSARPVVEFLLKARHHLRDIPGPTVVHCSAGIGRTGVFIGAEIGMQMLEEKGEVDILKIVSTMRQDRGGMVQTKDQYLFLYRVLVEYSRYLDEVRSPYKVAPPTREGVHRDTAGQSATNAVTEGARVRRVAFSGRQLEPPREEDEDSLNSAL